MKWLVIVVLVSAFMVTGCGGNPSGDVSSSDNPDVASNLCIASNGVPISSGDWNGGTNGLTQPKEQAFDGITNTRNNGWGSIQSSNDVSGNAWLGFQFNSSRNFREIEIYNGGFVNGCVTSLVVRYSDIGPNDWTTAETLDIHSTSPNIFSTNNWTWQKIFLSDHGPHLYWSVLATSNTNGNTVWSIGELNMMSTQIISTPSPTPTPTPTPTATP
jgi:hypothetical protein